MSVQQPRRFWPCALMNGNTAESGATIERQSKVNRTLTTEQEQQIKNNRSRTTEQEQQIKNNRARTEELMITTRTSINVDVTMEL